jgi:diadenylate cyclase
MIDILVVAVVVYQALLVVKGTRAGHILLGILAMVSLYAVALGVGLEALRSVLSYIVPYIGIAVIVLFQSEIRRTLARIGRRRWFVSGFQVPESVSEILLAISELQEKRTGALIVLERDIGLRTFIESGVRIDGRLSRDLLVSMFNTDISLHDGAVIVQRDRIAAAACFLPLTTNPSLSLKFGTRHRAGVGITEETDCLSIIVSEETGRVSLAAFGELIQGLSLPEVDERINLHFGVQQPAQAKAETFVPGFQPQPGQAGAVPENRPAGQVKQP